MICFWKSTPLKLKSTLLEKLPKDKVLCMCEFERAAASVCVCVSTSPRRIFGNSFAIVWSYASGRIHFASAVRSLDFKIQILADPS